MTCPLYPNQQTSLPLASEAAGSYEATIPLIDCIICLFIQAEDGIRHFCLSRGVGVVYKTQLSCYVLVAPIGKHDGQSSWGVRAMLRCGPVEQWIPGVYYGPRVTASVEVLGVGNSTDQLSFPRSWFENYGIKTTNIFSVSSGNFTGDMTSINFSQYPAGSIVSYMPITNPAGLYSNGITDWYNVEGSAHYENNNKTHNVTQLITYANGNQNKTCVSAINNPSVSTIPVIGGYEFQYRQNAPFACGN